ncbi:MAG: hypothetical protein ABI867_20065 [Kofleriaceae bacterium]
MPRAWTLVVPFVVLALAGRADADVLVLYGDLQGGGMYGKGTSGDAAVKDQAFFANIPNVTYGASISARFLFLGATIQHHQYVGDGLATWTQIMAGLDFSVDLGGEQDKKQHKGGFVNLKAGAGFGVGTGQQVDPPLDNAQIDDKGLLLGGQIGFGKHLSKFVDIGVEVPVLYGYFLKNGVPANDLSNHYQGIHVEALLTLRFNLKIL